MAEVGAGLQREQLGVPAGRGHQFGMGALLDQLAGMQDIDPVGMDDVGQAVGDQDGGLGALPAADRPEERVLGARVQSRGRFVHDEQRRIVRQRPCDLDQLTLRDRQGADLSLRVDVNLQPLEKRTRAPVQLAVSVTGIAGLLMAILLGLAVTGSIARPLLALEAGTRALSEGRLGIQVAEDGTDELTHLAGAFNRTSRELSDLYSTVRNREAHFRSLIENASDLIIIVDRSGRISYASPHRFAIPA